MIRAFFVEIVFPLLLFFFVRGLLRNVIQGFRGTPQPQPQQPVSPRAPTVSAGGELKKDPVCGTYVAIDSSLKRVVNGRVLHFCSAECRDKYSS